MIEATAPAIEPQARVLLPSKHGAYVEGCAGAVAPGCCSSPIGRLGRRPLTCRWLWRGLTAVAVVLTIGQASCRHGIAPRGDRPVPSSEPRRAFVVKVDLRPAADCEEAFDLRVYRLRSIDLLQWDRGRGCHHRRLTVRYLPRRATERSVFAAIRAAALRVSRPFRAVGRRQ